MGGCLKDQLEIGTNIVIIKEFGGNPLYVVTGGYMQNFSKAVLALLTLFSVGATVGATPGRNEIPKQTVWMVRVSIPDRPDFSVAAQKLDSDVKPFGVIPLKDASIPAIEVRAQERQSDFVIRLYAAKDYKPKMKCEELRAMLIEPAATLTAPKGKPITTASLAAYGVPSVRLLAYQIQGPVGEFGPCCGCGDLFCCPRSGNCLSCGTCGDCCRA